MLKLINTGNSLSLSYPLDYNATFEPGYIAELKMVGGVLVCGVSAGLAPIGIIDDQRTAAFTQPAVDNIVIFGPDLIGTPITIGGNLAVGHEVVIELEHPSLVPNSFITSYPLLVNYVNGVVRAPANSLLNFNSTGDSTQPFDSIRAVVSYTFRIPDLPGADSTIGSGRVTIWFNRGVYQTDVWDTTQNYPLNCVLYCGLDGRLTSAQPTPAHPGVAICLGAASSFDPFIDFLWL